MYICTAAEGTSIFAFLVVAEPIGLVPGPCPNQRWSGMPAMYALLQGVEVMYGKRDSRGTMVLTFQASAMMGPERHRLNHSTAGPVPRHVADTCGHRAVDAAYAIPHIAASSHAYLTSDEPC